MEKWKDLICRVVDLVEELKESSGIKKLRKNKILVSVSTTVMKKMLKI